MSLIGCFIPNECHKNLLSQYQKYCDKDNDINLPSLDIGFSRKSEKFQNWSKSYAILTEVPDHVSHLTIHQTKPTTYDSYQVKWF